MTRFRDVRGRLALVALVWAAACGEGATEPEPGPPPPPPNRAPVAVGSVPAAALAVGDSATLDVLPFFRDPDGDALRYTAASSNAGMASVSVTGNEVKVTGVTRGTATVTVTATDPDGLAAQQTFPVTVMNQAPLPVGEIPALELQVGESAGVELTGYFEDPDGDGLTFEVETSDAGVATAREVAGRLTVSAAGRGMAVVTVTARDPEGLSAQQTLTVSVANQAPAPEGRIAAIELAAGESAVLDLSRYFSDADGDTLSYSAATSNADVAGAAVDGDTLTVVAAGHGTAVVTVTAVDPEGLPARQTLVVSVINRPPVPAEDIPALEIAVGESMTLDASPYFTDPDGDSLAYAAATSNADMATVSATGPVLTIEGVGRGTATITVTASDPHGLAAQQTFVVTVPNRAPFVRTPIPDVSMSTLDVSVIDLSLHFTDVDGDSLTYAASVEDPAVASAVVTGSDLEVKPRGPGETTITVTATDPEGARARASFTVTVTQPLGGRFHIELDFQTAPSPEQEAAFREAAAWWESTLTLTELSEIRLPAGRSTCTNLPPLAQDRTIDDLAIALSVVDIDGVGGTLAIAGPCLIRSSSLLPVFGRIRFDAADLDRMERTGDLFEVILHEMAHVLGLGTLWNRHDLLRNASTADVSLDTHFAGPAAIAAFDEAGGTAYTGGAKVPVENSTGRSGSDNSHWRRSVFGLELLTAFQRAGVRESISAITIRSLADLGYTVNIDLAEPYRLPLAGARAEPDPSRVIFLGDDILKEPIEVVDPEGRTVRVIGGDR